MHNPGWKKPGLYHGKTKRQAPARKEIFFQDQSNLPARSIKIKWSLPYTQIGQTSLESWPLWV